MKKSIVLILWMTIFILSFSQSEHPRGIITAEQLQFIKLKGYTPLQNSMLRDINASRLYLQNKYDSGNISMGEISELALYKAYLVLLDDDTFYVPQIYKHFEEFVLDSILYDASSFGLSRAHVLKKMAIIYDFTANYLTFDQKVKMSEKLLELIINVSSSMGYEGNYAIESNWMGVRYGSIVLATAVFDEFKLKNNKSRANPYLWEARRRLEEHMNVFFTPQGWCIESMSYQGYDWSYTIPAFIALQNMYGKGFFNIPTFAPNVSESLRAMTASTVNIINENYRGIQADFADDDPMVGSTVFPFGMAILSENQYPPLAWMHNYLYDSTLEKNSRELLIYHFLYFNETVKPVNPSVFGWNMYTDTTNGVLIYRNRFKNEQDIVAAILATQLKMQGHSGPDNLSFRIIGLGNLWVVGAGRTGFVAGQTNLFPSKPTETTKGNNALGIMHSCVVDPNGIVYTKMSGSCMGVEKHQRSFYICYDSILTGCPATFIVNDSSNNGKIWRINTPEFNKVNILSNGFALISPEGDIMRFTVLNTKKAIIDTGMVRYGGTTEWQNHGIWFKAKNYTKNRWIDIACDKNIVVVITLAAKGKQHPSIGFKSKSREVLIGNKKIKL